MIDLINFQQNLLDNIMSDSFEVSFAQQVLDVFFATCEKVVQADHLQAVRFQSQSLPVKAA